MDVRIKDLQNYLYEQYGTRGHETGMFMKLVEEMGEVAEILNKRAGRKAVDGDDLQEQLANELVDVIHYAVAIAAINHIDLNQFILEKDKKAALKYHHERNLEEFIKETID
ncbi:MAG: nucleotide pyrophosphohydrolase [Erysipelotrichaceae bacterium]|nr:nucleotide pyrophosphohydrolase [Erysipelotrichaceae bacterium]